MGSGGTREGADEEEVLGEIPTQSAEDSIRTAVRKKNN